MPLLMAAIVVHGEVFDAEAVADSARFVAPGGRGRGRWAMTHCSALAVPLSLSGALYVAVATSPLPPLAAAGGVTWNVTVAVPPGWMSPAATGVAESTVQPVGA